EDSPVEQDGAVAELRDGLHVVGDEQDGAPGVSEVLHAPQAPCLELGVTHGEHLVHEQDLGLEMRGNREGETDVHAARVPLDRRVDEPLDPGELDDVTVPLLYLPALHREDRAVEVDVLSARELLVEARPDLEQAPHPPAYLGAPGGGLRDPSEDLQERRLARPVASDHAKHLPLGHLERDVPQRPELLDGAMMLLARDPLHGVHHRFAQRAVRRLVLTETVLLRKPFDLDRDRHQIVSAKLGSADRNVASPTTNSTQATATPTAT